MPVWVLRPAYSDGRFHEEVWQVAPKMESAEDPRSYTIKSNEENVKYEATVSLDREGRVLAYEFQNDVGIFV